MDAEMQTKVRERDLRARAEVLQVEQTVQPLESLGPVGQQVKAALELGQNVSFSPEIEGMVCGIEDVLHGLEAEVAANHMETHLEALCDGRGENTELPTGVKTIGHTHTRRDGSNVVSSRKTRSMAVCSLASAAGQLDMDASRHACKHVRLLKDGFKVKACVVLRCTLLLCQVHKKPTNFKSRRDVDLVPRSVVLTSDLTRIQVRDPAKPKV